MEKRLGPISLPPGQSNAQSPVGSFLPGGDYACGRGPISAGGGAEIRVRLPAVLAGTVAQWGRGASRVAPSGWGDLRGGEK